MEYDEEIFQYRSDTLTFTEPLQKTSSVTLIFKDIATVSERMFRWKLE